METARTMVGELERLAARRRLRVAGLMSGTSADGVSAAIVDIRRQGHRRRGAGRPLHVELLAHGAFPYTSKVREAVFRLFDPDGARVDEACHLNFVLGEVFADAIKRLCQRSTIPLPSLDLIGSHGQTICHLPKGLPSRGARRLRSTLQIGEPCVIAERTGVTTVADFRPRDMAAGGEGAPLVPYADYLLFRHGRTNRAIQNLGGIANVTYLRANGTIRDVLAFDTGPGNMLMDRVCWRASGGKKLYDAGGRLAAKGHVHERLLDELMAHPFLRRRPPKSTGREEFGTRFSDDLYERSRKRRIPSLDILATVTEFTAQSIAASYRRFLRCPTAARRAGPVDEVILCGGGAHNLTLRRRLEEALRPAAVRLTDEFGISVDAKEAVSFAILAHETIRGVPSNVPSATGARAPVVLGKIIPGRARTRT